MNVQWRNSVEAGSERKYARILPLRRVTYHRVFHGQYARPLIVRGGGGVRGVGFILFGEREGGLPLSVNKQ